MPGTTINDIQRTSANSERDQINLDFTWTPGGAPADPTFAYPTGVDSGAKKAQALTPLTFTASVRAGTSIVSYDWDFGDGSTGHGPVVQHVFRVAMPQLRVSLCVTNINGARRCVGHQMMLSSGGLIVGRGVVLESPGGMVVGQGIVL